MLTGVLLLTAPGLAATVKLSNSQVSTVGGPFTATVMSGTVGRYTAPATFNTFCVEVGEHFTPGTEDWAVVSDRARFGVNGTDGTDQYGTYDLLSPKTAFLYSNYMSGTMASLVNTWSGSQGDLIALQDAIWSLEDVSANTSGATANMAASLAAKANASSWTTIGNVRVMQLWTSQATVNTQGGQVQDQLVLVPTPTSAMAGFSLLAGLGLLGLRRKWTR